MGLYIWLIWHQIVIHCVNGACLQTSVAHFDYILGAGALELIFEIGGIIKVFIKKEDKNKIEKNNNV